MNDKMLHIGGFTAEELTQQFGTPMYVYDFERIREQVEKVRTHLPGFAVYYSLKANPNKYIAAFLKDLDCGFEIASGGELYLCKLLGVAPERIVFAGPGKSTEELTFAIREGIQAINVESALELQRVEAIAAQLSVTANVQIRVNTTSGVSDAPEMMVGRPSKFGIEEDDLERVLTNASLDHINLVGLHLYTASGVLDSEEIVANFDRACEMYQRLEAIAGHPLGLLDFGGGLGVPYVKGEKPLNIAAVGQGIQRVLSDRFSLGAVPSFIIDLGRYLVAESGTYLTRVMDVKQSRGQTFAIVEGGMHQFLRPVFMGHNHPTVIANRIGEAVTATVNVGGQLCTPIDMLANEVPLPPAQVGDLIAIQNAGAYGYSMSMMEFLSHPSPPEVAVQGEHAWLIRQRGTYAQLFDYE
jgi:diaminopimelate decarboxylase